MKKIFFISLFFLSFFSSGCVYLFFPSSSESISSEEPFYGYLKKELRLLRPMNLWQWGGYYSLNEIGDKASDVHFPGNAQFYNRLPVGTPIVLTDCYCIKDYVFFSPAKNIINVSGKVTLLDTNNELVFEYIWGKNGYLYRSPWEGEEIPEKRYTGDCGRDYDP